jgi:hypothetical protein
MLYLLSHRILCGSSTFDSKSVTMRRYSGIDTRSTLETNVFVVTKSVITSDLPLSSIPKRTIMPVCVAVAAYTTMSLLTSRWRRVY